MCTFYVMVMLPSALRGRVLHLGCGQESMIEFPVYVDLLHEHPVTFPISIYRRLQNKRHQYTLHKIHAGSFTLCASGHSSDAGPFYFHIETTLRVNPKTPHFARFGGMRLDPKLRTAVASGLAQVPS
jgi:hypothetical protein